MGEKVKVNKTDRQLLSDWIYTLFKHQTLHSMKQFRSWKTAAQPMVLQQQKGVQSQPTNEQEEHNSTPKDTAVSFQLQAP